MTSQHFGELHPVCILFFFVGVVGFTLTCMHPAMVGISCICAVLFLGGLNGWAAVGGMLKFTIPLYLIIAIANPLFNHNGVTMLFMLFDQWITLEAILYGLVSGAQLVAVILWFACYQVVMTSDKFLYLFGKFAPSAALLITMTLRLIPQLQSQFGQIRDSQKMLSEEPQRVLQKLHAAIRHVSTLLTWSMENAVQTADSMKARGYGNQRRTTFHLFRFDLRDTFALMAMVVFAGVCLLGRVFGHGTMEFYPRMEAVITGASGIMTWSAFALLALFPSVYELIQRQKHIAYFGRTAAAKTSETNVEEVADGAVGI